MAASFTRSDDLQGAEFVNVDLRGARFRGSDLSGCFPDGMGSSSRAPFVKKTSSRPSLS